MGKVPHWKSGPHKGFPGHKQQDQPKESPFQRLFTASELINPQIIPASFTPGLSCLLVQARHHPGIVCPETVGSGEKIQGKGNPLALNVKKKKKKNQNTHIHTKQVIPLENMRKWVVWNHWFCPFSALVLQLASTVRKIHVLLTYTSIWVTDRPGWGSVSWDLQCSAADRKTAIWVLTCHPEPLWFPWIPPRNRILGHDMK